MEKDDKAECLTEEQERKLAEFGVGEVISLFQSLLGQKRYRLVRELAGRIQTESISWHAEIVRCLNSAGAADKPAVGSGRGCHNG